MYHFLRCNFLEREGMLQSRCPNALYSPIPIIAFSTSKKSKYSLTGLSRLPLHLTEQPHCLISNTVSQPMPVPMARCSCANR